MCSTNFNVHCSLSTQVSPKKLEINVKTHGRIVTVVADYVNWLNFVFFTKKCDLSVKKALCTFQTCNRTEINQF